MKLTDQIFSVMPPAEWHTAVDFPFPDIWHAIAPRLRPLDIEELVWQSNFVIVASYMAIREQGRFIINDRAAKPSHLSVICSEELRLGSLAPVHLNKMRIWRCGCCATLSY